MTVDILCFGGLEQVIQVIDEKVEGKKTGTCAIYVI